MVSRFRCGSDDGIFDRVEGVQAIWMPGERCIQPRRRPTRKNPPLRANTYFPPSHLRNILFKK